MNTITELKPVTPEFPLDTWMHTLARMAEDLRRLSGSTEGEFLSIGARLHDFLVRAGAIDRLAGDVANQVGGEDILDATSRLLTLLDKMQEYLIDTEREAERDCESLRSVLHLLVQVIEPLNGFGKINKELRMLGISTKIESARLGNNAAGFDTLAADVANLSVQVLDKSHTILVQQSSLSELIRDTLKNVESIEAEQQLKVKGILEKTRSSIKRLEEINGNCSVVASVMAAASSEISGSMSEVVMSMQFHDIVRQQIEHVESSLDELHKGLSAVTVTGNELVIETSDICELQAAQLRQAQNEICSAVQNIIDNLAAVAVKEVQVSHQARELAGVADQAGTSFFDDMGRDLKTVAATLVGSAKAGRSISEAMNRVAGTVGEIVTYVGDIEHIGEEIELIAMNAQIKAARTGADGAALGVLAEAIQRLSVEAQRQTGIVSATLLSVTETTERLFHVVGDEMESLESEVGSIVDELDAVLHTLSNLSETVIVRVRDLEREVIQLSGDIEATTSSITVHELMANGASDVASVLDAIVSEAAALVPVDLAKGKSERLKELAKRYTMHSERSVHARFAGHGDEAVSTGGAYGNDDNIELF